MKHKQTLHNAIIEHFNEGNLYSGIALSPNCNIILRTWDGEDTIIYIYFSHKRETLSTKSKNASYVASKVWVELQKIAKSYNFSL